MMGPFEHGQSDIVIDDIRLQLTCPGCPEQYDALDTTGQQVGFLRLRHGYFRVDVPQCRANTIFEAYPKGDGVFHPDERMQYLTEAVRAIKEWLAQNPQENKEHN